MPGSVDGLAFGPSNTLYASTSELISASSVPGVRPPRSLCDQRNFLILLWSRHPESNRGPSVYKTEALPLSYAGLREALIMHRLPQYMLCGLRESCGQGRERLVGDEAAMNSLIADLERGEYCSRNSCVPERCTVFPCGDPPAGQDLWRRSLRARKASTRRAAQVLALSPRCLVEPCSRS
jgi:hypothetical protein